MNPLEKDNELLSNIKSRLPELVALSQEMSSHWFYEDPIYRFYHQSFKVYFLQDETRRIAEALKSIAPAGTTFCKEFEEIYQAGASGKTFEMEHNRNWTAHNRVFVEAFFHAKFFLEMASSTVKNWSKRRLRCHPVGRLCCVYITCADTY